MTADDPDWEFKQRDVLVLRELSRDPQLSSRDLARILEEKYDIDVSHVTVSESIRGMREEGVFREAIIPNEEYFYFGMFEFKFDPGNFAEEWRRKSVMMFPTPESQSRWIHEFYKRHGDAVDNLRNSIVHNVLKFRTDPEILESLPEGDG
ncbi:winged helix-turn-helix domain-containing protein [Halobacteriales archaeon QS_9_70_65]|nr:MAG: winged helix-turn-helix domain-containing protein [Halobacteriales archaeon QS_9_70_65]